MVSLGDILIISSIITGLVSIPFLVVGPLSDHIPTGKLVLGFNSSEDVESMPSSFSKTLSAEKFEKTYETPFGKFTMSVSSNEVTQILSKPGTVVTVTEDTEETVWKITTQQYELEITRTPYKVVQKCATPDGELIKTKEKGEITESFNGINLDGVIEICEDAEETLQEEVDKMEQIKSETELPGIELPGGGTTSDVVINEFLPNPTGSDSAPMPDGEWVELYNNKDSSVDVNGWVLYDSEDGNELFITPNNTNTGGAVIDPHGWLVVYRDGDGDFNLNNDGDEVRLYDGYPPSNSTLIDQTNYSSSIENKSWARIPDGTGDFEERDPTPGASNG